MCVLLGVGVLSRTKSLTLDLAGPHPEPEKWESPGSWSLPGLLEVWF